MNKIVLYTSLASVVILAGCSSNVVPESDVMPRAVNTPEIGIVEAQEVESVDQDGNPVPQEPFPTVQEGEFEDDLSLQPENDYSDPESQL